jgi:hypothetical protein
MKKQILSAILIVAIVIGFSSCKKEVEFNSPYKIGQYLNGGEIFYIDKTGEHGLITSVLNISSGLKWCDGNYDLITDTSFGSGLRNTYAIIGVNYGFDYSAYQCQLFSKGGFHDWYLPSKEELNLLYKVHSKIPKFDKSPTNLYWSSSTYGNYGKLAWSQNFLTGEQLISNALKDGVAATIAIRNF